MSTLGYRARRTSLFVIGLITLLVLSGTIFIKGITPPSPTGTWAAAGNGLGLSSPRAGAASVQLQDGRILITGGDDGSGEVATADIYDTSGNFSAAASMSVARSRHTATLLQDGTVLVAGGLGGLGVASNTAEIYNPSTNTWTATNGSLITARSGHTATALPDGTVLIAGGDNGGTPLNSLEIYDPSNGTFSTVAGSLSSPREQHAAAALQSGDVLIAGGFNGSAALATTDIYSFSNGSVGPGPTMSTPRQGLSATTQLDGNVLIAGGNNGSSNGSQDLASAEVYSVSAGTFSLTGSLATARQGHQAFLLPHNGSILIVGGTTPVSGVETATSSVEMYYPLASGTDANLKWNGTFNPTGAMASPRVSATGNPLSSGTPSSLNDGILLVAGGKDASTSTLSSGELYGFAWVKTDALDYAPGTTVNITGGGWQPGETVNLHFQESPWFDTHQDLSAIADSNGNISNSGFAPDSHDVNIRFYLTATGLASGSLAQTIFTDGTSATSGDGTMTVGPTSAAAGSTGNNLTFTFQAEGNNGKTFDVGSIVTVTIPTGWSAPQSANSSGAGYVSVSAGTGNCSASLKSISGSLITINQTCDGTSTFTFTYSDATAPGTAGTSTFTTASRDGTTGSAVSLKNGSPTVTVGAATRLVFTNQPTNTTAGSTIDSPTGVQVSVEDANGDLVNNSSASITLAIGTNPGNGTLSGTTTVNAVNGVATFSGLSINKSGTGYTLTTSSTGLTGATSNTFNITAGTATQMVFSQQPSNTAAGSSITPAVTVSMEDANNNVVTSGTGSTASITLAIGTNPGSGTLSGTLTQTASAGVATFSNLSINKVGTGYTLTASSTGLTGATSNSFNITAGSVSATTSTVSANPASVTADGTTTSTITVTLLDASGNPVSGKTVTLTPGGGSSTVSAASGPSNASGVVTFTVKDTKAEAVTYTAKDTSDNITITPTTQVTFKAGTAAKLAFSQQPSQTTAGNAITPAVTVSVEDANGNVVTTDSSTVTIAISTGGAFSGTSTLTAVASSGVATFSNLVPTVASSSPFTLTATDGSLTSATSAGFTVIAGALAKFVFATITSPQTAGTAFNVTITAEDANGNTVTGFSGSGNNVTLTSTGTLLGTPPITTPAFTNGVLTNFGVTITNTGSFTITATGNAGHGGGTGTSNPFTVNPGAAASFTVAGYPSPVTAGTAHNFTVTAKDANGNVATGYTGTVKFTSSDAQAVLPAPSTLTNGTGTFSATLKTAGTQSITATDSATSTITGTQGGITVNAAGAASVTATAGNGQSTTINTAFGTNLQVTVKDAFNNPVSGVTVTFTPPGSGASGAFSVTNTATTNASGVATANTFTANGTAGSYTVTASTPGATSANFSLTNNNPAPTITTLSPSSVTAGAAAQTLTINGTNFVSTSMVTYNGVAHAATFVSSSQLTIQLSASDQATNGTYPVIVTNSAPGGGTSNTVNFTVTGTPPSFTSGNATTFTAGTFGTFTVTASGTPTPTLSESGTDTLPTGVNFNAGTGVLSGTPTQAGTFTLHFTASNGVLPNANQTFTLTVNPGTLASIALSPATATITAGGNQAYTAQGFDTFGNSRGDVTGATTFSVTNGSCSGNTCSSTVAGAQTVTGNDGGVKGMATLNVTPGAITSLVLAPATSTITAGASQTYTAQGMDTFGNPAGDVTASTTFTIGAPGSCAGASCTSNAAGSFTVTGTYSGTGAQGTASLNVTAGSFTQLQILVPGETAAPGTTTGKTGTPNIEDVNGQFPVTVNATDANWNVVSSVTDTVHFTSTDTSATTTLPADTALANGTGTFNVTLETPENTPTTTITVSDLTDSTKTSDTSPKLEVIVVYTAGITPAMVATGQATNYILTISNAVAPNTNNLESATIAVPTADQGSISNVTVTATGATWTYDPSQLPGTMRFAANTANDAVAPGGTITITFTATSSASVTSTPVQEMWNTVAFSDSKWTNPLPLAPPEPTTSVGVGPSFTSANNTTFTYGSAGSFTVKTNGVPKNTLTESGAPGWVTFTDNGDDTATISGTPTAAGNYPITITAHNGFGADASQNFTLMVSGAALTITASSGSMTYGGTVYSVTPSFSGFVNGDTYKSLTTQPSCTTTATSSSPVSGSPYVTSCSGAVDPNYTITYVNGTVTVNAALLTITASSGSMTYGGPVFPVTPGFSGFVNGDTSKSLSTQPTCSTTATSFSPVSGSPYVTSCSGAAVSNYTITYVPGAVTINQAPLTISADNQSMTFGGTAPGFTASYSGFQGSDNPAVVSGLVFTVYTDSTLSTAVTDFQTLKAGSYPIVASNGSAANYSITYANGTLTVNKATFTGSVTISPVDPTTVPYGQPVTATVLLNSYGIGGVPLLQPHADPNNQNQQLPESLTVYLVPVGGGPSQAMKFGTATAVPTYDNTANTTGTTKTGWTATITGKAPTPGNYTAFVYGDDPGDGSLTNLNLADSGYFYTDTADIIYPMLQSKQLDVVPAALTITANSTTKTYGQTVSFAGTEFSTSGLVNGDTVTSVTLTSAGAAATAAVAGSPYPIIPSAAVGSGLSNYTISYVNGTLTVNKADATIKVMPYHITYDATAHTATGTATGVGGVDLSSDLNLTGTTHTNAGIYSSDTWSFNDSTGNYNNVAATTITDQIDQATASINFTPYHVTYDGNPHTAMGTATGVGGVNLIADLNLTNTTHTNAGTYSSDYWTFTDPSGNYKNVAATTITDQIDKANAAITVLPYSVTYDGNPHIATGSAIGAKGEALSGLDLSGTAHTSARTYFDSWTFTDVTGNYNNAGGNVTDVIMKATPVFSNLTASQTIPYGETTITTAGNLTAPSATPPNSDSVTVSISSSPLVSQTVSLSSGAFTATPNTSAVPASTTPYTITYSFAGDANFNPATDSSTTFTVQPANTSTTVAASPASSTLGDVVTLTATVANSSGGSTATPNGLVTFFDGATPIGSGILDGGATDRATFTTSLLAVGPHQISASYDGGLDFNTSASIATGETVSLRPTTVAVSLNPATVVVGQSSKITVTVTDSGTTNPPGTADTFKATGTPGTGTTGASSTLFGDGLVLVAGGLNSSGTPAVTNAYIYSGGIFTATGNLNSARAGATATLLPNGKILVAGGSSDGTAGGALNTAELFDPATGTFTVAGSGSNKVMTAPRFGATATLLQNGQVLIAGGKNSGAVLSSAELYNPATDTFTATGSLAAPRYGAAASLLANDKVLIAGGTGTGSTLLSSAELYDPGAGTFASTGIMNTARTGATATLLLGGKVLVAGGSSDGTTALNTAELYDSTGGTFTLSNSTLNTARFNGTATMLPNGMVLLAGGDGGNSAELYDAGSDKFDATGSLVKSDQAITATLLNNGDVLISGLTSGGSPAADAELYAPSFNPLGTAALSSPEATDSFSGTCVLTPGAAAASTCDPTVTPANVATSPHSITGTYSADGVHSGNSGSASLTVNKADTLTTVTSSPSPSIYGGQVTFSATVSVVLPGTGAPTGTVQFVVDGANYGSPVSLTSGTASTTDSALAAGSHSITAVYSGDSNFNMTGADSGSTASTPTQTVNPAVLTVTANPQTKVYGQPDPTLTYAANGFAFTDTASTVLTGTLTRAPGETVAGSPYAITQGALTANSNYKIAFTGSSLTITPATLTITANPQTKVYGLSDPTLTYAVIGFQLTDTASTVLTGALTRAPGETVAGSPYAITQGTLAANSNYKIAFTGSSLTITPATLTITANPQTKVYGQPDPTLTYAASGFAFTDTASTVLTGALTRAPGETVAGSPYAITQGALTANSNYKIAFTVSSLTITPGPLAVTVVGTQVYGTSIQTFAPTSYASFVNGDRAGMLTGTLVCMASANATSPVGIYTVTGCSGLSDPNYNISYVNGGFTVTQASTATTVVSSPSPSIYLQSVTFTATVADASPGSTGTPTGTVQFSIDGTANGSPILVGACSPSVASAVCASFSTASLTGTTHTILASYSGDTNFVSSSNSVNQTVIPAPVVTVSPTSISFTGQNVGTTSSPTPVTITNNGDASLAIAGISILSSTDSTEFAIQTNTTTPCSASLAAGSSCTINVTFKPVNTGEVNATLQITDNNDNVIGSQQDVTLAGGGLSTLSAVGTLYTDVAFATANTCGSLTLSGGSTVDSFNSAQGGFASTHLLSGGNVGTNGNVTLNGSKSAIYGSASVPSTQAGNCSKSSVTGLTSSGGAQVTGGLTPLNGPVSYPPPLVPNPTPSTTIANVSHSCPSGMTGCTNTGNSAVTLAPGSYGNVQLSGGTTANLNTGTYNFNSLTLSGKSILFVSSGPVIINIAGAGLSGGNAALDLSGGTIVNPTGIPANLQFFYGGARGVNLSGGSQAYATVYAPMAPVNMSGGTDFFGGVVGLTITDSGGTAFHGDTYLQNVQGGNFIWLTAVVNNVKGLSKNQQTKLYLTNSSVSFAATSIQCAGISGGTFTPPSSCAVPVPNAVVTLNSASATAPKTNYDLTNKRWATSVPSSALTGNTFVTGVAIPVPAGGFPSGIQNVNWSAAFSTDVPITFQWQWSAGVYSSFSPIYATSTNTNMLGVNPEDGSADLNATDPAGTPELYRSNEVIGFFSAPAAVAAAAAQMSTAPSNYAFASQAKGTSSASTWVSTLINNDGVTHMISGFSVLGTNAADFVLQSAGTNSCYGVASLAAGASCNLYVSFTPSTTGAETARIVVNDDANNTPQTVYLTGTGQ